MRKKLKIILLGILLFLSFLLYAPTFSFNQEILEIKQGIDSSIIVSSNDFFDKPGPINSLRKITSPFDLNYYRLYLNLGRNYPAYCNLAYPTNVEVILNNKSREINFDKENYLGMVKFGETYIILPYNVTYNTTNINDFLSYRNIIVPPGRSIDTISQNITVGEEVNYSVSAKMTWSDAIGNMFIFFLFWVGVIFLLKQTIDWIKEK